MLTKDDIDQHRVDQGIVTGSPTSSNDFITVLAEDHKQSKEGPVSEEAPEHNKLDLVYRIKGLYRILDLISDRGSGGLVDKVIIDQISVGRFINEISPGAYKDLTKVDFKAMDDLDVMPLGLYGSKDEIISFLREHDAIDDNVANLLALRQTDNTSAFSPVLRAGLYALVLPKTSANECRVFIIFWPEDTTWDDNAISTVQRNRTTFMRYLTKITDQIVALISQEHGRTLVWDDSSKAHDKTSTNDFTEFDDTDRLFTFEVATANEQEENVTFSEGIKIKNELIRESSIPESMLGTTGPEVPLNTCLISGDTSLALLTVKFIPSQETQKRFCENLGNEMQFQAYLFNENVHLCFNEHISHGAISFLLKNGLSRRYPTAVAAFVNREKEDEGQIARDRRSRIDMIEKDIKPSEARLRDALETYLVKKVLTAYPDLDESVIRGRTTGDLPPQDKQDEDIASIANLSALYPTFKEKLRKMVPDDFARMEGSMLPKAMRKVLICNHLFSNVWLSENDRKGVWEFVNSRVESGDISAAEEFLNGHNTGSFASIVRGLHKFRRSLFSGKGTSFQQNDLVQEALKAVRHIKAVDFFPMAHKIREDWPILGPGIQNAFDIAQKDLSQNIAEVLRSAPHKLIHEQIECCKKELERELTADRDGRQKQSRSELLFDIAKSCTTKPDRRQTIIVDNIERVPSYDYPYQDTHRATGILVDRSEPRVGYTVHPLELTEEDKHRMKLDQTFTPRPRISARGAFGFELQLGESVRLFRLLPNERCLVIIEDRSHDFYVYLETPSTLSAAVKNKRSKKHINREKTGQDIAMTYDEGKRSLAICGTDSQKCFVQLHFFVFDERYQSLQVQGSATNLTAWYTSGLPKIVCIHIISGNDELALLEDSGKVRVFSTLTQQFRPAVLQLPWLPSRTFTTPDGSCFGAIRLQDDTATIRMYHWASLGSHEGFAFDFPGVFTAPPVVSAFDELKNIHLFFLSVGDNSCRSLCISITRPATEFHFREKEDRSTTYSETKKTLHNSLVDCHSDVWTRFPVVPAIQRKVITAGELRKSRSIRFVTSFTSRFPFRDYFSDLIRRFERNTKKPTGSALTNITILECEFANECTFSDCSVYKAGQWLVDIFCLIPIHIAVARDNRFIPLKDGVWAPEVEKSLLGAEVGRVADSLSFGWYESIFQSYMATKNVKVVSSMGEQSVGKSFALNHLADTSFAGSAMRTTEGVWMSVTPTEHDLIVVLDFEGVHSIERSAQEDTLLVLFNAAISNLVLFRNNFALSRDITNLFQSFQSSSSILDPDANPSLFQSTLVIIIKDVVDSDRMEIAREFKLKLHKIVQEEQASNFISRLYRGRLNIIPWPVIESQQFYTLFSTLKKHLDSQLPTHEGGGAFLQKLKMLMAKLKTNDWGSLSQNMATHRAQHLLSILPRALSYGAAELEPEFEPLKNFDTNDEVQVEDSSAAFCFGDSDEQRSKKQDAVQRLIQSWPDFEMRQCVQDEKWTTQLSSYLQELLDQRTAHVQAWIDSNLDGFGTNNAAIEELRRSLDSKVIELKRSIQLCKTRCERCYLLCLGVQFHEGNHDCTTDHLCSHRCQFVNEHDDEPDACSLSAGHEGQHRCDPTVHLCGHPCNLRDKKGCQGNCTKVATHGEDDHLCSARRHLCGELCKLQNVRGLGGKLYTCQGTCSFLWDEEHEIHVCDAASCPIACQLCGRLCSSVDHLHGLRVNAIHLCGQEHKCIELCESKGVCEIDTVPQSIEATFSGAHDRFQYTKYSQATKRLPCAIIIPPDFLHHDGPHVHSTSPNPFHYCDARCDNCSYVCTLPSGHPQPEHSTNHGSMAQTRWVVDGPDGNALEIDGHKFGTNDDGAPMLCNLVCSSMGRHTHIDYCRAADPGTCNAPELDHIKMRIEPNPETSKDWVSHKLYWRRLGFKDPYSREEQANFAKCDAMCSGIEHHATASTAAQPSYCTLPIFHNPAVPSQAQANGNVSNDGHAFSCKNPAVSSQAFHVIFVIHRSGSMTSTDRRPLPDYPASQRITRVANNRLGAVYCALHSFWSARAAAMNQASTQARRDAYSAILFTGSASEVFSNDFTSSPDALLEKLLQYTAGGGTNFGVALSLTENILAQHWSTERTPIVIFLSDGECSVRDDVVYSLCRRAVSLGRAVSFQAVSFGPDGSSTFLRRMAQIAKEVEDRAPRDPLLPANAVVGSAYNIALDSVRLAETFLGIAESLRKTRGGLIR
ncbi:uncharacterized protein FOMMEDRAFT_112544 [Fomitiporia mediterranea MF3/22]|uniref:uncharacterized protein n=1 Tax=Fomitiporia mediterranea (strain MF3/22) TaxID=694068 RepID=UPI0004407EA7|nr:uncharacterized protein FOMMEDRAFT_112544 [Fomitiporia mediterranea MF3/22]EJD00191.1 hypothetical protein FOMMEDRAFT_112544 [Fomitiporia mediterranea MF3/22]